MSARHLRARVFHVGEYARRAAEDFVLEFHPVEDRDVVLDLDVVANFGPSSHENVLPNRAIAADGRAAHHVGKMPNARAAADGATRVDTRARVNQYVFRPVTHRCRTVARFDVAARLGWG